MMLPAASMEQSGETERYYPPLRRYIVAPVAVAVTVGAPFSRVPFSIVWATCVFFLALILIRWLLRSEVSNNHLLGRDTETSRVIKVPLNSVTAILPGRLLLWGLPGWALSGWIATTSSGKTLFLNASAERSERLKALLEASPAFKTADPDQALEKRYRTVSLAFSLFLLVFLAVLALAIQLTQ
jgi:hypothetical protein